MLLNRTISRVMDGAVQIGLDDSRKANEADGAGTWI